MLLIAFAPTAHSHEVIYISTVCSNQRRTELLVEEKYTLTGTLREMREHRRRQWLVIWGQALHLGGNEPPTLALMCFQQILGGQRRFSRLTRGARPQREKRVRFPIASKQLGE